MNSIEGVWIEFDHVRIFDPETGEDLIRWDFTDATATATTVMDVARAIRTFYVEGADGVRRLLKGKT